MDSREAAMTAEDGSQSNTTFDFNAGVGDTMIITGADFGTERGSVLFADANSGGRNFIGVLEYQIKEWTSSKIVVEVPYRAGTGKIRVDKANGESLVSSENVRMGYDHINVQFVDNQERRSYEIQMFDDSNKGGYAFQFFTDFASNVGATTAFESIMETWSCNTGVNFTRGADTEIDEDAQDGINVVRFDNGTELGGSTLGYARSRYAGCYQGDTIKWVVFEVEVVINDDYNWYYGNGTPANNQFDFETVMLHEIGHTHQLGHVINNNEVMHFAVGPGQQKRDLSAIDDLGGEYVTDKSIGEQVCGLPLMVHYTECCEEMVVFAEPENQTPCTDDGSVTLQYLVNEADAWQWQRKVNESWIAINDSADYNGTTTNTLTVSAIGTESIHYRAKAMTFCGEEITSEVVTVTPVSMNTSLTVVQPTCEENGTIDILRNTTEGELEISLDGGISYTHSMSTSENRISISLPAGNFNIAIRQMASGCIQYLGDAMLKEATVLTLSLAIVQMPSCTGNDGIIEIGFNDHPEVDGLEISIDNGVRFDAYSDTSGTLRLPDLKEGSYEIIGRWNDGTCTTTVQQLSLQTLEMPVIDLTIEPETCSSSGSVVLSRQDSSADLLIVIDGVVLNPQWSRGLEVYDIKLEPGAYNIMVEHATTGCITDLGSVVLEETTFTIGTCRSITVSLDETGTAVVRPEDVYDFSTETGCPEVSLTLARTNFSCSEVGSNEVILTITDKNGVTSTCSVSLTVLDTNGTCSENEEGVTDVPEPEDRDVEKMELVVYPNPSSDFIYFETTGHAVSEIVIYDSSGALVLSNSLDPGDEGVYTQEIETLSAGVYTVLLNTSNGVVQRRLVKL